MKPLCCHAALLLVLAVATPAFTEDKKADEGFVPMFNGKDLSGWVNVNCAPDTFFVNNNQIITTGKPTGYLRTARAPWCGPCRMMTPAIAALAKDFKGLQGQRGQESGTRRSLCC